MIPSCSSSASLSRGGDQAIAATGWAKNPRSALEPAARDGHRKVMSDKNDKPEKSWTGKAALAGAAIGSAAIAAALLYASRRKERAEKDQPTPKDAPETD
jgi:hypothetical protein